MINDTTKRVDGTVLVDAEAVHKLVAVYAAAAAAMGAMAESIQAQAVALHALADAIAAPMEEESTQDNRPRYMDGSLIEP